jgi:hypothetical protein
MKGSALSDVRVRVGKTEKAGSDVLRCRNEPLGTCTLTLEMAVVVKRYVMKVEDGKAIA